jgi:hypothetical protein
MTQIPVKLGSPELYIFLQDSNHIAWKEEERILSRLNL